MEDNEMRKEVIKRALERFKAVLESLECECDSYHGFTCTIHSDKKLVDEALAEL